MRIIHRITYASIICEIFFTFFLFPGSENDPLPLNEVQFWAYQLQGLENNDAITKIVNSRYDLVVIEPSVTCNPGFDAKDMVKKIKASLAMMASTEN